MIAGGKWWRANEIVICHHIRQTATRYRCREEPPGDVDYFCRFHPNTMGEISVIP